MQMQIRCIHIHGFPSYMTRPPLASGSVYKEESLEIDQRTLVPLSCGWMEQSTNSTSKDVFKPKNWTEKNWQIFSPNGNCSDKKNLKYQHWFTLKWNLRYYIIFKVKKVPSTMNFYHSLLMDFPINSSSVLAFPLSPHKPVNPPN